MAYIYCRLEKISKTVFEVGSVLPESLQKRLSKNEQNFLNSYNNLINEYTNEAGIDVTKFINPPEAQVVRVKAVKDAGEILTSQGTLQLREGNLYLLSATEAELLLKQGVIEFV